MAALRVRSVPVLELVLNHVAGRAKSVDAAEYERQTGVKWASCFTDVPDDGNCLMHAVWLGLKTLLTYYPELKVSALSGFRLARILWDCDACAQSRSSIHIGLHDHRYV